MKITVEIDPTGSREALCLQWQMPGRDYPTSLCLLPKELAPTQYPHAVSDLSKVAVFYGHELVLFGNYRNCDGHDSATTADAEVIHCNTFKLLEVLRKLYAKKVPKTVLDTARFSTCKPAAPELTIGQIAAHPNLDGRDRFGQTMKHFWKTLTGGEGDRTFNDLKRDLSRFLACAKVYAQGDEFYFNGRYTGGCGFNGGIIPHTYAHSYGIHT